LVVRTSGGVGTSPSTTTDEPEDDDDDDDDDGDRTAGSCRGAMGPYGRSSSGGDSGDTTHGDRTSASQEADKEYGGQGE
jgi:hypothetical protein